jgi:rhodanese-related sulfurtransferase
MPQTISTGFRALVEAAEREIETLPVEARIAQHGRNDVTFIDLRDIRELEREGRIPGAFHCPRGMLEFWIDPESPYHKPVFAEDRRFVFFCGGGWRSALAAQTAQRMGLRPSRTSPAGSPPGARPADRSKRRRRRPNSQAFSKIRRKQARTWRSVSTTCACSAGKSGKSAARANKASTPAFTVLASNALGRHSRKI